MKINRFKYTLFGPSFAKREKDSVSPQVPGNLREGMKFIFYQSDRGRDQKSTGKHLSSDYQH